MKKLEQYVYEARPRKDVDPEKVDGKAPEKNGSKGLWALNEPKDDEVAKSIDLDDPENTESMEDLIDKFDLEEDFFIQGEAGWGKTSIIRGLAAKYKRKVITVYLDKAQKEDIGGMPIPTKDKHNVAAIEQAMPEWASIMYKDPDSNYLLFFDEMNQADPGVMNALMPVVLEHEICGIRFKNFFVGAAGNFDYENDSVSELNGPLNSRFKPIIVWESNTPRAWKQVFNYLHKKYDNEIGKEVVDLLDDNHDIFENPREMEHKVIEYCKKIINKDDAKKRAKVEKIERRLRNLAKKDLTASQEDKLPRLAEELFKFINGDAVGAQKARKGQDMFDPETKKQIIRAWKQGRYNDGKHTYGISRESAFDIVDTEEVNAEMMQNLMDKFEADGGKFKYETDAEWRKAHKDWAHPNDEFEDD